MFGGMVVVRDPVAEAEGELAGVCGALNLAHARVVELVAPVVASGAWAAGGFSSAAHWVAVVCGMSSARAREIVRLAERRDELPAVMARFDAGELSVDQTATVARLAPAWADAEIAELASHATVRQLSTICRAFAQVTPPDGEHADPAPEPRAVRVPEHVTLTQRDDGVWRLSGQLDTDRGLIVDAALREARDRLIADGQTDVTWADALVEVCERSLAGIDGERRDRFGVYVHWHPDGTITSPTGQPLPDAIASLLCCDATLRGLRHEHGIAVSVGRTHRTAPAHTRRIVEHRDHGCRVPGCEHTRWLHMHHKTYWEHDGPTDTANLIAVCTRHHRAIHRGELIVWGDDADQPDGIWFTNHHHTPIGHRSPQPGRWQPPPTRYVHPPGQPWNPHDLIITPPRAA